MPVLALPIFPLPLVLFPGAPQLLHIFEPRYRQMLTDCMEGDGRFGLSWVEEGSGSDPEPEPGAVGCIAHVRASTPLPDGRSNILAVGEDRYVLLQYLNSDRPYRMAQVETFEDDPDGDSATGELRDRVAGLFGRFTTAVSALNDASAIPVDQAESATTLSFRVAAALELDGRAKQELLALRSCRRRLETLERLLRGAIADLAPRAEIHVRARRNGKGGSHAAIVRHS
jgi:Lon protease-like protein